MLTEKHQFVRVDFTHFKAFDSFTLNLRPFNILVGPNNAGKSTILAAFRILAAAMRRASTRKAEIVRGPLGLAPGHKIDLSAVSVAEENIFYNYDDSRPASVRFRLSNKNELLLYFPERDTCYLIPEAHEGRASTPSTFRTSFNCPIGFVPILGPVEHIETLYEKEAARQALFNYRAARNFRNIWYHYPEKFDEFRAALIQTWPGMDIEPPEINTSHQKPRLDMFCPEERIPREIFWAGFGFQVWCQMLTHIIQGNNASIFLIDEPDIYLHSDLQRQLIGLLRNMGPDILIATHSTEIITEAETDDIVLINKRHKVAQRIRNPSQLEAVFKILGSNLNPVLTQLAKTRRAVFVEGKDFQILAKLAKKLGFDEVGNRGEFAVVPVDGFNPERIRILKLGMETTLGGKIAAAAILDRDYRSDVELTLIAKQCGSFCELVAIHERKEIENFLLVPAALNRAAARRIADQVRRTGHAMEYRTDAATILDSFASQKKSYVVSQYLAERRRFERVHSPTMHEATINEVALDEFEESWKIVSKRLDIIPGKEAMSFLNQHLQDEYGVSLTPTAIIDAMRTDEVPAEIQKLVRDLSKFSSPMIQQASVA
jgi:energy-coupling factor transporter ATP-binding protein EcfA2